MTIEPLLQEIERIYQAGRNGQEYDFQAEVVPFVAKADILIADWQQNAQNSPYLRPAMVESAVDQLKQLSVQAFQPKTSLKRFNETIKSVRYIDQLMQ
ncbi:MULTISPECIES: DUF1798 family protein [Exiguobacterium]|uniref:DUF1798 family protein n=1 Tax=Exiguobacterium TaxID=33986 RepID=UPI000ED50AB8|nr:MULTISPECIES: DUF1798 family protein [Exiguobacterium]MCT4790758.1 YppE family protein [Exiguobacterium artemiae]MDW2884806.1 DUF1798 family protein [Exiguobacterium sibiricum]MDX1258697.1 YppE family protein [Exiguobacterium sp. K1]HCN57961.1 DUF1798 domain-containing protein [Exiguobacterium sp.]